MKTVEFEVSKGELFCLAAIQGFGSLLNVEYEPEESGIDLKLLFNMLTENLRNRKWLEEDFDGNMTIAKDIQAAILLCADAAQFWVVQSHVKKTTVADYIFTVYNTGSDYLTLEQLDNENYKGFLTSDLNTVKNNLFAKTPYAEAEYKYESIPSGEIVAVIADEKYTLINASMYRAQAEANDRILVCYDSNMLLFLENGGSYVLNVSEDDQGIFFPITQSDYNEKINSIFSGGEGV